MMKTILTVIVILIIVSGCESKSVFDKDNPEADTESNTHELHEAMNKIYELEEANQSLINQKEELAKQVDRVTNTFNRLEYFVDGVTQLEQFEYEILTKRINRPPYDCVVYVTNVPERLDEQEAYVTRSAIQFAGKDFTKVSLWKDRRSAMKYVNGDYDPEESISGWSGFDQRFGAIDNTSAPPSLVHYFSRDDAQVIEFGKYSYEK